MPNIKEMADAVIQSVRKYVDDNLKPVLERLKAVEDRKPEVIDYDAVAQKAAALVPVPQNGKDAEPVDVEALRKSILAEIPAPQDGKDAQEVDVEALRKSIVEQLPDVKDGKDVDMVVVTEQLDSRCKEFFATLPVPQNGKDADPVDVEALRKSIVAEIPEVRDGKDVDMDAVFAHIDKQIVNFGAKFELEMERRWNAAWEKALDRMPKPKDGLDALGFDDLTVEHDGERRVVLRFVQGERIKEFPIDLPIVIDRGVYHPDTEYKKGDGVTYGGSFYIAQQDAPTGTPGASDSYRLAVKKGRDGKDGKNGIDKTAAVKLN